MTGVQAETAIRVYQHLRRLIASKVPSYELSGEVEAGECYFGVYANVAARRSRYVEPGDNDKYSDDLLAVRVGRILINRRECPCF
jgi:hypothetical protein